jgi:polyhydroxybutyrate depolymerase
MFSLAYACGDDDAGSDAATDAETSDSSVEADAGRDSGPEDDAAVQSDSGPQRDAGPDDVGVDAPSPGSAGCTSGGGLSEGEHTFMMDGYERRYIVRLPDGYSADQTWPLIFALHGNGGTPDYWDNESGDRDIRGAFADEAILILGHAIDNQWRNYDDRDNWEQNISFELRYFDAIVEEATSELCIDEENIFSMGFSGGGSFSGLLGCRREYIRAISVGGSVIYFDTDDACVNTPAAWITIGQGEQADGRSSYREFFRDLAGCDEADAPDEGCVEYSSCAEDDPVIYCTHPAGHQWPDIATDATRDFFRQFYVD